MKSNAKTRVTVILNKMHLDEGGYIVSQCHEENFGRDGHGCWMTWDEDVISFFPWSSVLRVEMTKCDCPACGLLVASNGRPA